MRIVPTLSNAATIDVHLLPADTQKSASRWSAIIRESCQADSLVGHLILLLQNNAIAGNSCTSRMEDSGTTIACSRPGPWSRCKPPAIIRSNGG
jgi:hypothetical protein